MTIRRITALLATSAVLVLGACGTDRGTGTDDVARSSPSVAATSSPQVKAYLEAARPWSSSIEPSESATRGRLLLAVGRDWCRWRRSAEFGSISDEQFFGELLIGARDGTGIKKAAERHLCSS